MNDFYVGTSDIAGFGCFTRRPVKAMEKFTFSVVPIPRTTQSHHKYPFDSTRSCIILSEFSYCNHSKSPNVEPISMDITNMEITFVCLKDIQPYSELTFDYGDGNVYP
jgi:hypothetical protein